MPLIEKKKCLPKISNTKLYALIVLTEVILQFLWLQNEHLLETDHYNSREYEYC